MKQDLIDLLIKFGIPFEEEPYGETQIYFVDNMMTCSYLHTHVRIQSGIGYSGFICDFYFDTEDKFLCHGVWE